MRFTVDTSIIIAVVTNEPSKQDIVKATRGAELLAPASLHWEVGNALSAMLRRGRIDATSAKGALAMYREIPLRLIDVDLEEALALVSDAGLYAYDAYMLACARSFRAPLLTLDRRLQSAAYSASIPFLEVAS